MLMLPDLPPSIPSSVLPENKLPPTHTLRRLVFTALVSRGMTMALAFAFVLVAPHLMADQYALYVYYTRVVTLLSLILAIGSCGVINRFTHGLSDNAIDHMMGYILRRKYSFFLVLASGCLIGARFTGHYAWLLLLPIALIKTVGEAFTLLLYSQEQYAPRLYSQTLFALVRIMALPLSAFSMILYIAICDSVAQAYGVVVFIKTHTAARLGRMLLTTHHDIFAFIERKLERTVEYKTYQSNFLFFALPLTPILVINHVPFDHVDDASITYMIAIGVVYSLMSSVNDIILPTLIAHRTKRSAILRFLAMSWWGALLCIFLLLPAFSLARPLIVRFYAMQSYTSMYHFLIYAAALVVINSNRQILYIYDRIAWLNRQLLLFYTAALACTIAHWPILTVLTTLSALLAAGTTGAAFMAIHRKTLAHA